MSIKNGDFLLVNYTLKVKETGETVGTTLENVAKETKLFRGEEHYEPFFLVVGEGWVPKGLDEALTTLEIGKESTIELPPEKAYGVRDPKKVRLVPLRKFRADGLTPVPGLQVNVDGKTAQVRAVGAGRVQVDYNHPFSGRTLIYNLTVEKQVDTEEDRIRLLVHRQIPSVDQQKFLVKLTDDNNLELELPEEAFFLEGLQVVKRTLAADIEKLLPKIGTVIFIERFKKAATASATETKPVTAAPTTS